MKKIRVLQVLSFVVLAICLAICILSEITEINKYIVGASFFIAGADISGILLFYASGKLHKKIEWLENRVKMENSIAYRVKFAGEKAFNEMPLGIIVYSEDYRVEWANQFARKIFMSSLVERKFANISMEFDVKIRSMSDFDIELYGKQYNVTVLKKDRIVFLRDKTEFKKLEKKYTDRTQAIGIINLDNFDEAVSETDPQTKALKVSEIIGLLSAWAEKYSIYIKGYSDKQYLVIMDRSQLERVMSDEFEIIDAINYYCNKERLRITASIGVACEDTVIGALTEKADNLLELALNRGGSQAVVEIDGNIKYFGGKVKGVDTRAPVYVRVKTEDLCGLIAEADNCIVMSHINPDADALGAGIAALKIVQAMKKEGCIVFNPEEGDATVTEVFKDLTSEHIGMLNSFAEASEALKMMNDKTLLIIVDVQCAKLLTDERIYRKARKTAIIDHHRSNNMSITDYDYLYNKTTSSSSVELLVEMFDYIEEEVTVNQIEATLMLLGIITDTGHLMYRTSYQTFAVISRLQTYGAEMTMVQKYLREDFDLYLKRMNILNNLEMVENKYAIAACSENEFYEKQFLAKVADDLILVEMIKAGFCIGRISENEVGISARSLDEVNVQLIMEVLGGGGHFNNAATQIKGITIAEAKERLSNVLREQKKTGEETMKIILVKEVKGKGKANDVIEVPSGHANYLIRTKFAILATPDNLSELKRKSSLEKQRAQEHLEAMRKEKVFIEANPISIAVRVGKEGKLFGSVSTKQIAEEIENKFNLTLDKRKIMYDKNIDHLGTYEIPIQLHKEVIAKITLHVIERTEK